MTQLLSAVFAELGLGQYLEAFLDQGFDTWETILDITESDLDTLGVKLGHRRKLQRRIANTRGVASDASLVSPTQPSIEDLRIQDSQRIEASRIESGVVVVPKRKYRRHPKPDENAPERPPSAYVLFSNRMREELKGRNLSFTEIAKLVGENWQNLNAAEKEPYELQAQAIKEKYLTDLLEYKKTPEYKKYTLYLQEFKAKHGSPSQDKEGSKRVKMSDSSNQNRTSPGATPNRASRSGSRPESRRGSEPPATRQHRVNSTVSTSESQYSTTMTPTASQAGHDDAITSPALSQLSRPSSLSPTFNPRDGPSAPMQPHSSWADAQRQEQPSMQRHLPSLSDVFDSRRFAGGLHSGQEVNGFRFQRDPLPSPGPLTGHNGGDSRPPMRSEPSQSSTGSSASTSSYGGPRTPMDGQLPVHSLLGPKAEPYDTLQQQRQQQHIFHGGSYPVEQKPFAHGQMANGAGSLPAINGYHPRPSLSQPAVNGHPAGPGYGTPNPSSVTRQPQQAKHDARLDGMSALLQAGEIVDRRAQ
ncbi:hypothetical protein QBC35DRAFT_453272 [Podospora australis]|uniref:HMG box domain-containing protein n=1 Tax=Podospora australis TaxID=1536484 RepID=A0AAN7AI24_9PEZI|nr:hypothetical protein QBC35DRAFT_453272 [Podospora australis]